MIAEAFLNHFPLSTSDLPLVLNSNRYVRTSHSIWKGVTNDAVDYTPGIFQFVLFMVSLNISNRLNVLSVDIEDEQLGGVPLPCCYPTSHELANVHPLSFSVRAACLCYAWCR